MIMWTLMCAEMRNFRERGELATVHALRLSQALAVGDDAGFVRILVRTLVETEFVVGPVH